MKFISFLLLVCSISACSQGTSDRVHLRIIEPIISKKNGDGKIQLELQCKNLTDSTFLLYGIDGAINGFPKKVEELCNYLEKMSAGAIVYIYDDSMRQIKPDAIPLIREFHSKYRTMPKERADSLVSASNAEYVKHTKVISGGESIYLQKEVDLTPYELPSGTYYLQVAYCSGDKISIRVPQERINRDKKEYSATVFRGCAITEVVKLEIH